MLIWLAFIGATTIGVSGMFGPQAAYFSELFGPRPFRGLCLRPRIGLDPAGGPAPFLAAYLMGQSGGKPWSVALYIIVLSLLTAFAVFMGPERIGANIG